MTNELFSFNESGHGFVWEACCPEHECQCRGQAVWLYTCCISRTTQWISTRVFMPEWSSLTNVVGRISVCPYHYLELKPGLIDCRKGTNCYISLNKQAFKSATGRKLFVCVGKRTDTRTVSHVSVLMCSCVCQKYVDGYLPAVRKWKEQADDVYEIADSLFVPDVTTYLYRPMHIACSATPFLSTAALAHREPPYAGTSGDSRSARGTTRGAVWKH